MNNDMSLKRREKEIKVVLYQYYPSYLTIQAIGSLIVSEGLDKLTDEQLEVYLDELKTELFRRENYKQN